MDHVLVDRGATGRLHEAGPRHFLRQRAQRRADLVDTLDAVRSAVVGTGAVELGEVPRDERQVGVAEVLAQVRDQLMQLRADIKPCCSNRSIFRKEHRAVAQNWYTVVSVIFSRAMFLWCLKRCRNVG